MNRVTDTGNETTLLYAGPLTNSEVVLPVGEFELQAEIYDEANAYGVYIVSPKVPAGDRVFSSKPESFDRGQSYNGNE